MKREFFALLLLALLIAGALLNIRHIDNLTQSVSACLDCSEAYAQQGDFDGALAAFERGLSLWHSAHGYTNIFIRHPELDDTYDTFYELEEILLQQDAEAFPAVYSKLQYHLSCISFMEHLSAGSVF